MSATEPTYPDDVETLQALLRERDATIDALTARMNQLLAKRFGASSEQVAASQLGLFNEAEALDAQADAETTADVAVPAHTRTHGKRAPLPSWLTREEVVYDLDAADKVCPHDGATLEPIGEETLEQVDVVPMTVQVTVHRRLTYACPCCHATVRTAEGVPHPIPKSQASPGLLAHVAVSKFCDALPLYRQSQQFARLGVD
ncbi:MAG: IS66 family transposase zinc-finger binding domain-containing protein, partial [Pseudomonadota bacterium]